jgi:hypothetical protein
LFAISFYNVCFRLSNESFAAADPSSKSVDSEVTRSHPGNTWAGQPQFFA